MNNIVELQRRNRENVSRYVAAWSNFLDYRYKTEKEEYLHATENALYDAFREAFKAHWEVRNALTLAIGVEARKVGLRYPKDGAQALVLAITGGLDPVTLCHDPYGYWAGEGEKPTGYTVESFEEWRY